MRTSRLAERRQCLGASPRVWRAAVYPGVCRGGAGAKPGDLHPVDLGLLHLLDLLWRGRLCRPQWAGVCDDLSGADPGLCRLVVSAAQDGADRAHAPHFFHRRPDLIPLRQKQPAGGAGDAAGRAGHDAIHRLAAKGGDQQLSDRLERASWRASRHLRRCRREPDRVLAGGPPASSRLSPSRHWSSW